MVRVNDDSGRIARLMWAHFEPIHAVCYFHPRALDSFRAAGLRGYWRGYFASRAAPLGAVDAAPVIAAFFGFAPQMVTRALPHVWEMATPQEVLRARLIGAVQALAELTYDQPQDRIAEAADVLEAAVDRLELAGRVLGSANAALPRNESPLARLWQAATTLREQRGDGHVGGTGRRRGPPGGGARLAGRPRPAPRIPPARTRLDRRGVGGRPGTGHRARLAHRRRDPHRPRPRRVPGDRGRHRPGRRTPVAGLDAADVERIDELLDPIGRAARTVLPTEFPLVLPDLPQQRLATGPAA